MDISKFIDLLKLTPRYLIPVVLVSSILLFAPLSFLDQIGLSSFATQFKPYIAVVFLLSSALSITHWVTVLVNFIVKRVKRRNTENSYYKRLENLSDEEKKLLKRYMDHNTKTQYFFPADGVALGLEAQGILFRVSDIGEFSHFPYNIQPWAWEHLKNHRELLES